MPASWTPKQPYVGNDVWDLFQARTSLSDSFPDFFIQSSYVMRLCEGHWEETCWSFPSWDSRFLCLTHSQKKKRTQIKFDFYILALHLCQHVPAFARILFRYLWIYFEHLTMFSLPAPCSRTNKQWIIRFAKISEYPRHFSTRLFWLSFQSVHSILLSIQLSFHILFQLLTFRDGWMRGPWQRWRHS